MADDDNNECARIQVFPVRAGYCLVRHFRTVAQICDALGPCEPKCADCPADAPHEAAEWEWEAAP
jgi:hypothetical protein